MPKTQAITNKMVSDELARLSSTMERGFQLHEKRFEVIEGRLGKIEHKLEEVLDGVTGLSEATNRILDRHELRIQTLEQSVLRLQNRT